MKILSVAIPCYNSAAYMDKCIKSLLAGGDDVEIIIVDDGSVKDNTAQIADDYAAKYPGIIKAVHQENGGHGEAVNTGLKNSTGKFFKVVDSDDWVDLEAYEKILAFLMTAMTGLMQRAIRECLQRLRSLTGRHLRGMMSLICLYAIMFMTRLVQSIRRL